jgi:hypothetical protein
MVKSGAQARPGPSRPKCRLTPLGNKAPQGGLGDPPASQPELIREAIDHFLEKRRAARQGEALQALAGMWRDREDLPDFEALRASWDREVSP